MRGRRASSVGLHQANHGLLRDPSSVACGDTFPRKGRRTVTSSRLAFRRLTSPALSFDHSVHRTSVPVSETTSCTPSPNLPPVVIGPRVRRSRAAPAGASGSQPWAARGQRSGARARHLQGPRPPAPARARAARLRAPGRAPPTAMRSASRCWRWARRCATASTPPPRSAPRWAPCARRPGSPVTASVLVEGAVTIVEMLQGKTLIEFGIRPGSRLDFHASAHGLIALAFGPPALLADVLSRAADRLDGAHDHRSGRRARATSRPCAARAGRRRWTRCRSASTRWPRRFSITAATGAAPSRWSAPRSSFPRRRRTSRSPTVTAAAHAASRRLGWER